MSNASETIQLAVIGGGPGGYAAAFLAADLGVEVALIDVRENPGGVCLYEGCIPSKALLHAAEVIHETQHAESFGLKFAAPELDLDRLRKHVQEDVVQKLTGGLGQLSKARKVRYIRARARFASATKLQLEAAGDAEVPSELEFEHAIIASGSVAARPPVFPESDRIWDNKVALETPEIPQRLLVVGGGYIGLEMSTVYAALGSRVTIVEMTDQLLPGADQDLVKPVEKLLRPRLEKILLGVKVTEVAEEGEGLRVKLEGPNVEEPEQRFDRVLLAVGRRPRTEDLGLENTAVRVNDQGFIETDRQMRTSERSIFAIGDVAGQPMLAHKASHEGRVAAEVIAGHEKVAFDPYAIPAVVFTDPEIAYTGLTEMEAKKQNREVQIVRFPWQASGRALGLGRTEGFTKLLIDPESERLLGAAMVGPGAGELIAEATLGIEMGATARDLALTIHPHPTLSETVMESAEVFFGTSTHLYRPKK